MQVVPILGMRNVALGKDHPYRAYSAISVTAIINWVSPTNSSI
jgi:hypothetical protein